MLQLDLKRSDFFGILPDNAASRASAVRVQFGLMGELAFWNQVQQLYEDQRSTASVDSELSLILVRNYQRAHWLPNPFHHQYDRLPFIDSIRAKRLMVCRLDGPDPDTVRRMAYDAASAERQGLEGTVYLDARGLDGGPADGYSRYDRSLVDLADLLKKKSNLKVVLDQRPELFAPGACPDAALYCGWYSLRQYVDAFQWRPGAVGFHVASAEASTLRIRGSNVWCKRMLEEGAAATLGPVSEPYLSSFPLPDEFFPLLMSGRVTLMEAYHRTSPFVSWRQTLIGDPLYSPFKNKPAYRE